MIIVDTAIWIDHLHKGDSAMFALLETGEVLLHPFVRAEIALGSLRDRALVLAELATIPQAPVVSTDEVLARIEHRQLYATGLGFTDAHLVAWALVGDESLIWTRDRRLERVAQRLGVSATA